MKPTASLLNENIRSWGKLTRNTMEYRLAALGINERGSARKEIRSFKNKSGEAYELREATLRQSLRVKYGEFYGDINRIAFRFSRHGIFLERGVGKGRKKGSGKEQPRKWIEPTIAVEVEKLADIVANRDADRVVGQLRFLVPGVIDLRVDVK
jgi:hypothetical protein